MISIAELDFQCSRGKFDRDGEGDRADIEMGSCSINI